MNDGHILDLKTKTWMKPNCKGMPPSPRESHTATVVGEDKVVIFVLEFDLKWYSVDAQLD